MGRRNEAASPLKAAPAARFTGALANVDAVSSAPHEAAVSNGNGRAGPGGIIARIRSRATRPRTARRLAAAGDAERERIQKDIHDGLQQHLTRLRIELALASDDFRVRDEPDASAALKDFGDDVDKAIDELRELAHGIYPALLASEGLRTALSSASLHAAHPVTVRGNGVRRCQPAVETAVYFSCLAAIDNAAQHAGSAHVSVDLVDMGHELRFMVSDDGAGFDPDRTPTGSGIANMRDRIAAIGGTLTVESTPTRGTRVTGNVPQPWLHATAS